MTMPREFPADPNMHTIYLGFTIGVCFILLIVLFVEYQERKKQ